MSITEFLITGYDGVETRFAMNLTTDGAEVVRPGTNSEGETVVVEAWEKATDAFEAVRDLLDDILSASTSSSF
jgi:hypothetical protein